MCILAKNGAAVKRRPTKLTNWTLFLPMTATFLLYPLQSAGGIDIMYVYFYAHARPAGSCLPAPI